MLVSSKKSIIILLVVISSILIVYYSHYSTKYYINYSKTPNFSKIIGVKQRKQQFFAYLLPIIVKQNKLILNLRQQLKNNKIKPIKLEKLSKKYNTTIDNLLTSIDIVPISLALAQAAVESNWGRSRFASYNNYYGIWCLKVGCGVVPNNRTIGDTHEVSIFNNVKSSVIHYMFVLNSHNAYAKFRNIRKILRENSMPIQGKLLTKELDKYSAMGKKYGVLLNKIILDNNLSKYDSKI